MTPLKHKVVFGICMTVGLFATSCKSKPEQVPNLKVHIQEGLPVDLIESMNRRQSAIVDSSRGLSMPEIQSVILVPRLWAPGELITVAFKGGSKELRQEIAEGAGEWEKVANIKFDFGYSSPTGQYREWSATDTDYKADVRIAFDSQPQGGYWSAVGKESIDPLQRMPNKASMNFQGFTTELPSDWRAIVIHEFVHVLGFEHEHQGPNSSCEQEYRWQDDSNYVPTQDPSNLQFQPDRQGHYPGIYTVLGGFPNHWTKLQIEFNLKKLPYSGDLFSSPFDKASIMKYHFDEWMYRSVEVSTQTGCYSSKNLNLSPEDIQTAEQRYPLKAMDARKVLDNRIRFLRKTLSRKDLNPEIRTMLKGSLMSIEANK